MKICKDCNKEKDLIDFYKNINYSDGLVPWCKKCSKERSDKKRELDPPYVILQRKQRKAILDKRRLEFAKAMKEDSSEIDEKVISKEKSLINELNPRFLIYKRDGYLCYTCGGYGFNLDADQITLDHIYPKSLGGEDTASNLVTMCKRCNSKKSFNIEIDKILKCLEHVNKRNEEFKIPSNMKVGGFSKRNT